jgi:hypothetical protein
VVGRWKHHNHLGCGEDRMGAERVSRGFKEGGGWGKNGVPVTRRCQPCREAKIAGKGRREKAEGKRERHSG